MTPWERPQLRPDLELLHGRPEEPEGVLAYDPARRAIFELAAEDLPVLRLLDGGYTVEEIARQAGRPLDDVFDLLDDLADRMLLADPELDDLLAAWRRQHEEEDRLLQPILDSRPPEEAASRPILVVDDARHTCLRCGACCHYAVPISPEERQRLEEISWPGQLIPAEAGRLFQVRPSSQWGRLEGMIATRSHPTRCAFLNVENLCRIQEKLGPQAKPFPCRLFPLTYPVLAPEGVLFSLTFECPYIHRTYEAGERLAGRQDDLRALLADMEEVYALPPAVPLDGEAACELEDYLSWEKVLLEMSWAPATDPGSVSDQLRRQWAQVAPLGQEPVPGPGELAALAEALGSCARESLAVLADGPEGKEGSAWAVRVLESLAIRPEEAWAALPWEDGPAADRFLNRFVRHFVEGKQHLLYQPLSMGVLVLKMLLLLARADAWMMAQEAGQEHISLAVLNRALARWCRLLDIRPLRLTLLRAGRE